MKKIISITLLTISITSNLSAKETAISPQIEQMFSHYKELKKTAQTPFEKWLLDMWSFNIASCAYNNSDLPLEIKKHKVSSNGSYSLIDDIKTCNEFASKGFLPQCYQVSAYSTPFTTIPNGFMIGQGVFVAKNSPIPLPNSKVFIGAKCLLIEGNYQTEQFYAGHAIINYDKMRENSFNTRYGMQPVLQSSVFFHIDGLKKPIGPTNMIQLK